MPAIPVQARVEAHLTDAELRALNDFLNRAIATHQNGVTPSPMAVAAGGNQIEAGIMLRAVKELSQAVARTFQERSA